MTGGGKNEGAPKAPAQRGGGDISHADSTTVEIATGLTQDDVDALKSDSSPAVRAEIAVKFAQQFDRLNGGKVKGMTAEVLTLFSSDQAALVRRRFAEAIKTSRNLPPEVAARLARDDIEVAAPILESSPVLDSEVLEDIIKTMQEAYALAITGRKPLSEALSDRLIEHKGTLRVIYRLIDNAEAALSDAALHMLHEWGNTNPDIRARLVHRPNLPFEMIHQYVVELAEKVQWASLRTQSMSKFEANQLLSKIGGKTRLPCKPTGTRYGRMRQSLKHRADIGNLLPSDLLAYLRDGDIDMMECGFAILAELDLKRVRNLLYGSDKRGLIALCLKAGFTTADYLGFRVALGLAELSMIDNRSSQPTVSYNKPTMQYAQQQFEKIKASPGQIERWCPDDVGDIDAPQGLLTA